MAASASDENGEPETAGQRALAAADSAKRLLGLAEASADLRARAQALTACVKAIESLARFTDESKLKESAGWKAAMALIVKVLPSYPAALAAVVAALEA